VTNHLCDKANIFFRAYTTPTNKAFRRYHSDWFASTN